MTRYRNAVLAWAGTAAWMWVIYQASARSDMHAVPLIRRFGFLPWALTPLAEDVLEWVLRKGAHVVTYAILALLARVAFTATWPPLKAVPAARWAWLLAVAYAVSDEWHQTLVPGRDGRWFDVLIDSAGAGLALWLALRRFRAAVGGGPP